MLRMDQDVTYLQGVGPRRALLLSQDVGIRTVGELLDYFPTRYEDRSRFYTIRTLEEGLSSVQLCGEFLSFELMGSGSGRRFVGRFTDGTGVMEMVWFRALKRIQGAYDCHVKYVVFGKLQRFGSRWSMVHPEVMKATPETLSLAQKSRDGNVGAALFTDEAMGASSSVAEPECLLRPVYGSSEGLSRAGLDSQGIARLIARALSLCDEPFAETLSAEVRGRLMSRDQALRTIHHPTSASLLAQAEQRLKFEELFFLQLRITRYAARRGQTIKGIRFTTIGRGFHTFYREHLPFQLTQAQQRVVKEIWEDMRSGRQMNRLLQGDVGCGKTLVALLCALIAIDNGTQACLMAPTEILAEQHVQTLREMLSGMPIQVDLLTGNVTGKQRREVLERLERGQTHLLVGTHAVIEEGVRFLRLGLAIIDEQHRFGVAQRARLWQKSEQAPHVLVMTATPIPRTLAMTLYGDLDVSVIDELPPGRKPVTTRHISLSQMSKVNQLIRHEISLGRQAYIVYPLIAESQKLDLLSLEQGYAQVVDEFPQMKVSMVHGRMKPSIKDEQMRLFAAGETQILVATTVIEVGVNVPNASVMVIQSAQRFGLSQLHQLRGRVGRGADQSYCLLVTPPQIGEDTRQRLQAMVDSNDGFVIAEQDLKLRGPGDLQGTRQSGMALNLRLASLARDGALLQHARHMAQQVVKADYALELPENQPMHRRMQELFADDTDWSRIS